MGVIANSRERNIWNVILVGLVYRQLPLLQSLPCLSQRLAFVTLRGRFHERKIWLYHPHKRSSHAVWRRVRSKSSMNSRKSRGRRIDPWGPFLLVVLGVETLPSIRTSYVLFFLNNYFYFFVFILTYCSPSWGYSRSGYIAQNRASNKFNNETKVKRKKENIVTTKPGIRKST